ncbi:MAG TPA: ABC transporter ATP-binding protein [Actinomycetota bacterium]|nr:ABC transporter ATP-binding protein [Actinomycetota bacterium]
MSELAIEVRDLRKRYGQIEAVRGLDLAIRRGEIFALLGPNGAGKTTTLEILEGHRPRDAGEVSVLGFDPGRGERAFRERIGIVLQETSVEPYLKVEEAVELFRGYYPAPRPLEEILEVVGLREERGTLVRRLSGGQQRRLDVALGLAGNPDLLFLDEPTTGFDPAARRGAWGMVRNLRTLGTTVVLTTHYLDEAQHLADRVAIVIGGRIVSEGSPEELTGAGATTIAFVLRADAQPPASLGALRDGERVTIRTEDPVRTLHELTGWALNARVELEGLSVSPRSLEELFLELTAEPEG